MHEKYLDVLCCPHTGELLTLQATETEANGFIISGELLSTSGRIYPIVRGVPRFVDSECYAASFGYEWTRWPRVQFEAENVGGPMEGHTTRMWEIITGAGQHKIENHSIVEFGCGPGRFLDVVRKKEGIAIGIDISMAVEVARKNFSIDTDVLIVQGDIYHPPFRPGTFDGGYTIGVLHHTPTPERGLVALANTIKRSGWVACVVYPKLGFYAFPSVERYRKINSRLKPYFGYRFAFLYAYFSAYVLSPIFSTSQKTPFAPVVKWLEEQWFPCLYIPDSRWRVLDIFDGITPEIASTHTRDEVTGWMEEAGCNDFVFPAWGDTAVVGIKD
jgi:SAM-dependent methyltransferase